MAALGASHHRFSTRSGRRSDGRLDRRADRQRDPRYPRDPILHHRIGERRQAREGVPHQQPAFLKPRWRLGTRQGLALEGLDFAGYDGGKRYDGNLDVTIAG